MRMYNTPPRLEKPPCPLVIFPKLTGLRKFTTLLGGVKKYVLKGLLISYRNVPLILSRNSNLLPALTCVPSKPGPLTTLRPAFPGVNDAGYANALMLAQG